MVYTLRFISDEKKDFFRDIEISNSQTFGDLHNAIQEELEYDKSQMASFFLCTPLWEKEQEITLIDMKLDSSSTPLLMESTTLESVINEKQQRILYIFDFFSERAFFIELTSLSPEIAGIEYPRVNRGEACAPEQIAIDTSTDLNPSIKDLYDDEYDDMLDSSEFVNIDDLDDY